MAKTRTFKVVSGRMQFKCPHCQAKRLIGVAPHVRRRSFKYHKCHETTNAHLNRRVLKREQQFGKIIAKTVDGKEIEAQLFNISQNGVGFEIPFQERHSFKVGKMISFSCPWNPRLLGKNNYIVRSISNRQVGAEKRNT